MTPLKNILTRFKELLMTLKKLFGYITDKIEYIKSDRLKHETSKLLKLKKEFITFKDLDMKNIVQSINKHVDIIYRTISKKCGNNNINVFAIRNFLK